MLGPVEADHDAQVSSCRVEGDGPWRWGSVIVVRVVVSVVVHFVPLRRGLVGIGRGRPVALFDGFPGVVAGVGELTRVTVVPGRCRSGRSHGRIRGGLVRFVTSETVARPSWVKGGFPPDWAAQRGPAAVPETVSGTAMEAGFGTCGEWTLAVAIV